MPGITYTNSRCFNNDDHVALFTLLNFFSSKTKANNRNWYVTLCFGLMNYIYRLLRIFLKGRLIALLPDDPEAIMSLR